MVADTTDNTGNAAPSVDLSRPFGTTAPLYRAAGWSGTLWLPPRRKHSPPRDYTGKRAPYPSTATVVRWCDHHGDGNICLRLAGVDSDYEVIGVDVDQYIKGDKAKVGFDQLTEIERELDCELPPTWVSSARIDGKSGIRYFRVPRGLRFRGKAADDIEIVQKRHRFAVVWPSINPDTGGTVYWWFPPGASLDGAGRTVWDGTIPDPRRLPLLPAAWLDFLTNGGTKESDEPMDMDSSLRELYDWAYVAFGQDEPLCYRMREKTELHLRLIRDEATSHDKLTNAHMNIFHLATEGHRGWDSAALRVETEFKRVCAERDKRSLDELRGEVFRSRTNGLRKAKGISDQRVAINAAPIDTPCECSALTGIASPARPARPPRIPARGW